MVAAAGTSARLQIGEKLDPTSSRAFYQMGDNFGIRSDAANALFSELELYLSGDLEGLSFLIAGHRGAGKTTLVWQVGRQLLQAGRNRARGQRPLMVPLNGPRLLPVGAVQSDAGDSGAESSDASGDEVEFDQIDNDVKRALIQFAVGLCTQLSKTMARAFRDRIREREHIFSNRELQRRYELAARLELELDLAPRAAVLRELWLQGGYLESGVLFSGNEAERRKDQGLRELVALSTACDVYRRVSGIFTKAEETQSDNAARATSAEASLDTSGRDVLSPVMALLTGGLVGTGVGVSAGTTAGVITGLIAALGASSVLKVSASRSNSRTVTRDNKYERDLTLNTLDRELPKLIGRIRQCGLAPIFIIDELDKVNLEGRITRLVRDLKTFVAEQATFCFLADRRYYEAMIRKSVREAYPKEYTYFKRRLFIAHGHRELHEFLVRGSEGRISLPSTVESEAAMTFPELEQDRMVLPYCLLHQARMHPIDLERCIASLDDGQRGIDLDAGLVRSRYNFRQDLTIQLAIEMMLEIDDVDAQLRVEPEFRRFIHDALYYPTRCWAERGNDRIDTSESGYRSFKHYLKERGGRLDEDEDANSNGQQADAGLGNLPELVLTESQTRWLWRLVKKLVRMLSDPIEYVIALDSYNHSSGPVDRIVIDAISIAPPVGPLLVGRDDELVFDWRRSPSGRRLLDNGRQGLYFDLKLRLACHDAVEVSIPDVAERESYYLGAVADLRRRWLRNDPCEFAFPVMTDYEQESEYLKKLVFFEACNRLSGNVPMGTALAYLTPASLQLALSETASLGTMLVPRQDSPESVLNWVFDAKGELLQQEPTAEDAEPDHDSEPQYAGDLIYVRNFRSFIDSLANI